MPVLRITEREDRVRLDFGGLARGEGRSLQEAADELIRSLLVVVAAYRTSGFRASSELPPDLESVDFLHELGEIAAAGGDIRSRVFG